MSQNKGFSPGKGRKNTAERRLIEIVNIHAKNTLTVNEPPLWSSEDYPLRLLLYSNKPV
jgi:hypothetical protein